MLLIELFEHPVLKMTVDAPILISVTAVNFENELIVDSSIEDIDHDVVKIFKSRIEAEELDDVEVLKAYKEELAKVEGKYTDEGLAELTSKLTEAESLIKDLKGYSNRSIVFIVDEAAKLAKRRNRSNITEADLREAIEKSELEKPKEKDYHKKSKQRKVGFGSF